MRIDKFLFFARLTKTRTEAQQLVATGAVRLDGQRIDRVHAEVRIGATVAMVRRGQFRVVEVRALPVRRGPAAETRQCYHELIAPRPIDGGRRDL